ncbi:GspH/FimT family pseudopilin [Shewanella sedimentimangrovi]|uniref:Type II secretion system protein H n=1 Tax=Shewanella sedimentimangrovi TaxID=2814293 RepID=A0ABX7R5M6_9GAMM|nr:GspH/FimT family pseudopilin [Shewanella sedimentimangrovi]QSX38091.1 GspH/FimT family pseudopilin [Shewanella sedimentimangrovi]
MQKYTSGLTLIELMVTLVVAITLVVVGVPSMMDMYQAYRAQSEISRIQDTLRFARNQAVSYGTNVTVCPYKAGGCGASWSDGLRVYLVDAGGNQQELRVVEGINSDDTIKATGNVTFTADGLASSASTFVYCPAGEVDYSRSTTVSVTGIIKSGADGLSCQ